MSAYVFVDNSNLFIEGQYAIGTLLGYGLFDRKRNGYKLDTLRIEYGLLLQTILQGRELGASPVMVGSRPPPNDSMWQLFRTVGFTVKVFDRNRDDKEKKVDVELACSMMDVVYTKPKGVLILVSGDGDYQPAILRALENGFKIEIWFWTTGTTVFSQNESTSFRSYASFAGTAGELKKPEVTFRSLDSVYKTFCYSANPNPAPPYSFKVEELDGRILRFMDNSTILKICASLDVFGHWTWFNENSLTFHLIDKESKRKLKEYFQTTYASLFYGEC